MLLQDFLKNPSGKSSAMFYNRQLAIKSMEEKLSNYVAIKDSKGKRVFSYEIFKKKDSIIFKFKLPSEKYTDLYYDILLKFDPPETGSNNLADYSVSFFSNSPAFTFTYTFVLNKMNLLFDDLKKCNKKALTEAPSVKNPVEILGFEKSIYVCGLYIFKKKKDLMNVDAIMKRAKTWTIKDMTKIISSDQDKLVEYNVKKKKQQVKDKTEKQKKEKAEFNKAKAIRDNNRQRRESRKK